MPRARRKQSSLCINHIILRGINQQIIFEDQNDYLTFISVLKHFKHICSFKLYAYCIMDNHIHLLIEHTTTELDIIMKRIEVTFVKWYNRKYKRTGYLFQDRFKSEPVEDLRYFQTVFRYIHQNPLKAGIEQEMGIYPWSSYRAYALADNSFIDIDKVIESFGGHLECMDYLHTITNCKCLEDYSSTRLPDTVALQIIQETTNCTSPSDFQHLDLQTRNTILKQLHSVGLSLRQLSRLTGISRTSISSAIKEHN